MSALPGRPEPGDYAYGPASRKGTWDGHTWTGFTSDPDQPAVPHRRSITRFIGGWWFVVAVVGYVAAVAIAVVAQQNLTLPVRTAATVGSVAVMLWLVAVLNQRVRLGEAMRLPMLAIVGVIAGAVAYGIALACYRLLDGWGMRADSVVGNLAAGPVEELSKLVVPLILWVVWRRCRDPRSGFGVVLIGAAVFGVIEAWQYTALDFTEATTHTVQHAHHDVIVTEGSPPDHVVTMAASRPIIEVIHPIVTAFAAAVVWRQAWLHGRLVTAAGLGAVAVAIVVHAGFDAGTTLLDELESLDGLLEIAAALLLVVGGWFWLLRPTARELTSPNAISSNAEGWRPKRLPAIQVREARVSAPA